jgi:hypothetical protein
MRTQGLPEVPRPSEDASGEESADSPQEASIEALLPPGEPLPMPAVQVGILEADGMLEFLKESREANPLGIPFTKDQAKKVLQAASVDAGTLRAAQSIFDKACLSQVQDRLERGQFEDAVEYVSRESAQESLSTLRSTRLTWVVRQGHTYRPISLPISEYADVYRAFLARNEAASKLVTRVREVIDLGEYLR